MSQEGMAWSRFAFLLKYFSEFYNAFVFILALLSTLIKSLQEVTIHKIFQ